ncbi:MAG: DUF2231 domain-containing protein [Acidobacteria bacterium]|nr:DUF2231 domain-containing protein [Acidobacteriota bacterium]
MGELFPGLRALPNLHPVFIHFPLALLPLALVFQLWAVVSRRDDVARLALWLLCIGALAALAAAGSGLIAEGTVEHAGEAHEALELHEKLMLTATGLSVALAIVALLLQRRPRRATQLFVLVGLLVICGTLAVGADRGGLMVYHHGVGVRPEPSGPAPAPADQPVPEHQH